MFDNVGGKVKGLAKFVCWVGIICSVIGGIALLFQSSSSVLSLSVLIGGILSSWLGSLSLYAIGSAADDAAAIRSYLDKTNPHGVDKNAPLSPLNPSSPSEEILK